MDTGVAGFRRDSLAGRIPDSAGAAWGGQGCRTAANTNIFEALILKR